MALRDTRLRGLSTFARTAATTCGAVLVATLTHAVLVGAAALAEPLGGGTTSPGGPIILAQQLDDPYSPRRGRVEGDRWVPGSSPDSSAARAEDPYRAPRSASRRDLDPEVLEPLVPEAGDPDLDDYDTKRPLPRAPVQRDNREYADQDYRAPRRREREYRAPRRDDYDRRDDYQSRDNEVYTENEIVTAGHRFFGSVSQGLAKAIQRLFRRSGRPNGFILGQDAGGAFVAGLRYGEGTLHTKRFGKRRVYWQGPSVGYDFGGEGSKVMVLVYNLRSPREIYRRFGGVQGSAYLVGGVSVQLQKHEHVTLAPIRAGVGLRLGANIGYLKYTRRPTWNPF